MKVAVGSAFRNSVRNCQLLRYFAQLDDFITQLHARNDEFYFIAAEGDSEDTTKQHLQPMTDKYGILVDVTHGQPEFGSTEQPERFAALSGVGNGILSAVPRDVDVLIYVESDLVWSSQTLIRLMERLDNDVDIVAPLIFAGNCFYDVFAYRGLDGERFAPFFPYHSSMGSFSEVSSVGSCLVMKGEVARNCRVTKEDVLVGFCRHAKSKGYRIWVDGMSSIRHC